MVSPAAAFLALLATAADVESQLRTVTVSYEDLNLSSVEGSRALYRRLVRAAEKVCPPRDSMQALRANRAANQCVAEAVERAARQVNSARFAEVAAAQKR